MKLNNLIKAAVVTAVSAGLTLASGNALAASATANATATVMQSIAISKTTDLAFGSFSPNASGGTVVMSTAGARSATGTVALATSTTSAAAFNVTGTANATYAITLPTSTTISNGGTTMTVDTFTSNPSGTGTLSAGGSQTLAVGATLHVGASQASGSYTGTFNVSVDYN